MKLCFSVDALSLLGNKAWRLQKNNTWRPCKFAEDLQSGDTKLTNKQEVGQWFSVRLQKDKELGLKPKGKAGIFDFMMRGIFSHVIVHRLSPAPVPNKNDMMQVIAQAEVGTPWLLYLDLSGNFRMLHSEQTPIMTNPDIAVRGEIASAAGFIGKEAVQNTAMMNTLYHQFVAGWLMHLETRRLSVFIPDTEDIRPLGECIEKIKAWQHERG